MATLQIRKKSSKTWLHIPSDSDEFILSKFYCKTDDNIFKIVEESGSSRKEYLYGNITVYDDTAGGAMESFASSQALMIRLESLKYVGFNRDGDIPTPYIESIVAGTNITIDDTDPLNPIISSSGGGSGATLGLIKIVDKAGDFFTNLSTASAYIRTFTSATITDESFSNGTFWFTVPNGSSFALIGGFLNDYNYSFYDPLGLITSYGVGSFGISNGEVVLGGNVTFDSSCFDDFSGIAKLKGITLSTPSTDFFGENSTGRFEIYGTIGTTTAANYTNFFPTSTAVIWALKVNETNNAGGLEGDLATAQTNGAKLFFGYADGGATDLSYTPSPTDGIVVSSTGADATIPLADNTNAGLLSPSEKSAISEINKTQVKLTENINKGQVVYVSGANGTNILVSKASNATEATSSKVLGLLETTGVTNDIVNVVTFKLLSGLNTSTATIGDAVWLGTSGNLIYGLASKPIAPAHLVYIGVVSRVSATVGEIFINIQNGFELNEIHDVLINTPLNNQVLAYETASGLWKNNGNFGQILHSDSVPTSAHTGTTTITQIGDTIVIPANTFSANDAFVLDSLGIAKTGTAGTCIWRLAQNTSDTITGANILASASLTATQITGNIGRKFEINGGNLKCRLGGTTTGYTDMTASTAAALSVTFDPTITQYFFRLATLSVGTDSVVSTQIVILK